VTSEAGVHAAGDTKSEHFLLGWVGKLNEKHFSTPLPRTLGVPNSTGESMPNLGLTRPSRGVLNIRYNTGLTEKPASSPVCRGGSRTIAPRRLPLAVCPSAVCPSDNCPSANCPSAVCPSKNCPSPIVPCRLPLADCPSRRLPLADCPYSNHFRKWRDN
jgi:hypothetical protein